MMIQKAKRPDPRLVSFGFKLQVHTYPFITPKSLALYIDIDSPHKQFKIGAYDSGTSISSLAIINIQQDKQLALYRVEYHFKQTPNFPSFPLSLIHSHLISSHLLTYHSYLPSNLQTNPRNRAIDLVYFNLKYCLPPKSSQLI